MTTLTPKYDQGGTGAVNRPFNEKLAETVSVLDFGIIPDDIAAAAGNKTKLLLMITEGIKAIYIPEGTFYFEPEITFTKTNIAIYGAVPSASYSVLDFNDFPTKIIFTSSSTKLFGFGLQNCEGIPGTGSSEYSTIQNVAINCNNKVNSGILLRGTKNLTNLTIYGYLLKGIEITNLCNQTVIDNVTCSNQLNGEAGTGLHISGVSNTTLRVSNCEFRQSRIGVYINNLQGFTFENCVIESNAQTGMLLENVINAGVNRGVFSNVWFENNGTDATVTPLIRYQLILDNFVASSLYFATLLTFNNCNFGPYTGQGSIRLNEFHTITFNDCIIGYGGATAGPSIYISNSVNTPVQFNNCNRPDYYPLLGSWTDGVTTIPDGLIDSGSRNLAVISYAGKRFAQSNTNNQVTSAGYASDTFSLADTKTVTMLVKNTNTAKQGSYLLMITDFGSGGQGVFSINSASSVEIVDSTAIFTAGVGPTAGQINIYGTISGDIAISNNMGSARTITLQVLGAVIYDVVIT